MEGFEVYSEKDKATEELVRRHFEIDPEKTKILRFLSAEEDDPMEPIKLLEVTPATVLTGEVQVFGFGPAKDFAYSTLFAEVTPSEFDKIERGIIELPSGWRRDRVKEFDRDRFFATASDN